MRLRKKGSFTVEATFLMPLIIGVFVLIIYMGFYYYNRGACIYTAHMTASVINNNAKVLESEQGLRQRTIAMDCLSVEVTEETNCVEVVVSGKQRIPFVNKQLSIKHCEKLVRLNQREFILQCKIFQNVL